MLNEAMDARRQRGLVIAAYRVVREADGFRCACPDFEMTGRTCKHGYAVEFMLRREMRPDGTVIETRAARVTYSQPVGRL
jgi:hypothetical protein